MLLSRAGHVGALSASVTGPAGSLMPLIARELDRLATIAPERDDKLDRAGLLTGVFQSVLREA